MFDKKTVIITGASSGLGRQMACDLAANGANCALFGRTGDKLAETRALCEWHRHLFRETDALRQRFLRRDQQTCNQVCCGILAVTWIIL